jgi:hypothetical protein
MAEQPDIAKHVADTFGVPMDQKRHDSPERHEFGEALLIPDDADVAAVGVPGAVGSAGVSPKVARADHIHQFVGGGSGGVTDHGGLTGLGDDDHPQYLTNARGDALFLTPAEGDARYATPGQIVTDHGLLTGLADDDHPQYLTQARGDALFLTPAEGNAAYDAAGAATSAVNAHAAAADPHAVYLRIAEILAGANITITDNGNGTITIASSGTGSGVPTTRNLTAGTGLTGGGDLSVDRTFNVGAGTGIAVAADTVALDTTYADGRYVTQASLLGPSYWYGSLALLSPIPGGAGYIALNFGSQVEASGFSWTSGSKVTCNVSGRYKLIATLSYNNPTAGTAYADTQLIHGRGASTVIRTLSAVGSNVSVAGYWGECTIHGIVNLTAGDWLELRCSPPNSTTGLDNRSWMSVTSVGGGTKGDKGDTGGAAGIIKRVVGTLAASVVASGTPIRLFTLSSVPLVTGRQYRLIWGVRALQTNVAGNSSVRYTHATAGVSTSVAIDTYQLTVNGMWSGATHSHLFVANANGNADVGIDLTPQGTAHTIYTDNVWNYIEDLGTIPA